MTTPYRNEIDALRERKAALEQETQRLREQRAQLEWLSTRQGEIDEELHRIDTRLRDASATRRTLPLLDQISVASPCHAKWDEMLGDDRVRFCLSCEKNVFNLSAMPRDEAERLVQERSSGGGGDVCVRFYQRADGTVMTSDCPVGVKKKRRKKLALAVVGAGAMALGATSALLRAAAPVQGKMEVHPTSPPQGEMMGQLALPPTPPPVATPPPVSTEPPATHPPEPHPMRMGRMIIAPHE